MSIACERYSAAGNYSFAHTEERERYRKSKTNDFPSIMQCTTRIKIDDLFEDIKDGVALLRILEVLSKEKLVSLFFSFQFIIQKKLFL